jgi:hypothetical protein
MQDPATKAEHYRKAANKYGEMAKQADVDYVAEIYRKVGVRYVFMAEDLLNWSERRREVDVNALAGVFLDRRPLSRRASMNVRAPTPCPPGVGLRAKIRVASGGPSRTEPRGAPAGR